MGHNISKTLQMNGQEFDYTDLDDRLVWHEVSGGIYSGYNQRVSSLNVTSNINTGVLLFYPIIVEKTITITEFLVSMESSSAGRLVTAGIYSVNSTTGLPNALIINFGEYNIPTTSTVTKTGYSQVLAKGTYYIAYTVNQNLTNGNGRGYYFGLCGIDPTTFKAYINLSIPFTYSTTLPTDVSGETFTNDTTDVIIGYRYKIA